MENSCNEQVLWVLNCTPFWVVWLMIHATQDPLVQHVVLVTQLCLTLCNPMDCILLGSSVHGILQPRILDWVANAFSIVQHIWFLHLAVIWVSRPCRSSDWLSLVLQCLCSSKLYLLNNGLKCKSSDVGNSNKPKRNCKCILSVKRWKFSAK